MMISSTLRIHGAVARTAKMRLISSPATASASKSRSQQRIQFGNAATTCVRQTTSLVKPKRAPPHRQRREKATLSPSEAASSSSSSTSTTNVGSSHNSGMSWLADYFRRQRTVPIPRWITPSHQTISVSEMFGHSSFVLVAISYAVDDFLMLRCIAVVGSTAMLFFAYFHPHGRALWLPFKWNALFIAINSYRIGKVLLDRHFAENLSRDFLALRDEHFHLMDPVDFAKLVRLGKVETFSRGQVLVGQGQGNRHVRLILAGELEVQRNGKMTYLMNEANFVSESGLHTGLMLPGSVASCCTVVARSTEARVLTWERDELLHLLERDASVHRSLQNAMSWDIVRKLKEQRLLISSNLIEDPEQWTERRNEQTQHRYIAILQNLLQHPRLLNSEEGRVHLHNYRIIHHIDDEHHEAALKECGWTPEEFERGYLDRDNKDGRNWREQKEQDQHRGINWYAKDLYLRMFG